MSVHGALGEAEFGRDLRNLQVVLPPHLRNLFLPGRQPFDDLPRPLEGDHVQRLGRRVGGGGLVADLNVTLPSAEHLHAPELADVLIRHRREQPGALPPGVMLAQRRPRPGGRLERVLNQVGGELPVPVGAHARMTEEPLVMSVEETAQFRDMGRGDLGFIGVSHAPPPSRLARPDHRQMSTSCLCSRAAAGKPLAEAAGFVRMRGPGTRRRPRPCRRA
jgi:hypothetical protein